MFNDVVCKEKAVQLVSQMTLEEKASQLTYNAPAIPRLNIPAYNWWNEALHGVARAGTATSFPQAIGLAAMFDEQFLEQVASAIAEEGRAKYNESALHGDRDIYKGLTFWSPNINIFRDPRWGRGHETYGEDPYLTSRLGVAFIKGLQGHGEHMKVAACAKHFAVHSGPEDLRHEFDAQVSPKDLWETYLPAFEACVKEGQVESVMGAYNRTNGEPCCGSYFLIQDILRGQWQFNGHFVSDCWAIKDFHMHHHVTSTPEESAALAMDAGCDLNCGNTYLHVMMANQNGLIPEEQITKAAERLFTTRFKLGLFEDCEYDTISFDKVECQEHIDLAVEAARKSVVLLKNENILPLNKKQLKTIGVIGPNANSRLALKGNYYGTSSRYITLLEGIQDEVGDEVRVLFAKGCELIKRQTEGLAMEYDRICEALSVAEHSDVVILCLGLDETLEGEEFDQGNEVGSGDKKDLELPQVQKKLLERVVAIGKPVILCMMTGSAMNLSYAEVHCKGILQVWYPGARGGKAVADILFGKTSPSGKLPVTFYQSSDQLPAFTDYAMKGRTYRYMKDQPLYPFGYGLSYGKVFCEEAKIMSPLEVGHDVELLVKLFNDSLYDTEEVLQVYVKNETSQYAVLNTSLCAFKRVALKGKAKEEVKLTIPWNAFTIVDAKGERRYDSSTFSLFVGTSQPDTRSEELTKMKPVQVNVIFK